MPVIPSGFAQALRNAHNWRVKRSCILISTFAATLLTGQTCSASGYEALINTPEKDPCHLFEQTAGRVVLFIDMPTEGKEVPVTLPREYLENRSDWLSGLRHGSVFFRLMIHNALPVHRQDAERLDAAKQRLPAGIGYVSLLLGDFEELSSILATLRGPSSTSSADVHVQQPDRYGLNHALGHSSSDQEVFTHLGSDELLDTVIECRPDGSTGRSCTHYMSSHSLDVVLEYPEDFLPRWFDIRSRVSRFLGCATLFD